MEASELPVAFRSDRKLPSVKGHSLVHCEARSAFFASVRVLFNGSHAWPYAEALSPISALVSSSRSSLVAESRSSIAYTSSSTDFKYVLDMSRVRLSKTESSATLSVEAEELSENWEVWVHPIATRPIRIQIALFLVKYVIDIKPKFRKSDLPT
jgi:hypothetical protein